MSDEPTDLWVGPRQVRWWDNPAACTHSGKSVCPGCSELTAEEAAAIREYVERLRAAGGVPANRLDRVAKAIGDALNEVVFGESNEEAARRLAAAAIAAEDGHGDCATQAGEPK